MEIIATFLALAALALKYADAQEDRFEICNHQYEASSVLGNFTDWAVSSEAGLCATVPRKIQSKEGNMADAAVATLLCMGVVLPHFMGIGGGFIATHYSRNAFWNFKCGRPLKQGDVLVQKDLARTLEAIAHNGADYFYEGPFAEEIVREISNEGSILTIEDLRSYQPTWTPAVSIALQDGRVLYTAPPPSSGAVTTHIVAVMDAFRNNASAELQHEVLTLHRFVEAGKFGYASRSLLGDPRFDDVNDVLRNVTSWDYANATRWKIDDDRTYHDPVHCGLKATPAPEDRGTAHLSLWEDNGDALSITSTINGFFGSLIRSSSGVILNNQMNGFSTPGESNIWGLSPFPANFIEPGKRPQTSMSPAVVVDPQGDVEVVIGASGGSKIITAVSVVSMRTL
ncbi:hypothetical protein MRX96_046878 [Rhipicephalus microplus]